MLVLYCFCVATEFSVNKDLYITYFKYLHFKYLTALQTNTQNNLGFSHALPAARAVWLNAQNSAWFGSQIYVICYATAEDHAMGEGGMGGVLPARVQGAEPPLGVWGETLPEAGVLMHCA